MAHSADSHSQATPEDVRSQEGATEDRLKLKLRAMFYARAGAVVLVGTLFFLKFVEWI
jgi:hypothetical protein